MAGFIQTVDVRARLVTDAGTAVDDAVNVVSAEIERVFAGGGSQAEVEVVFADILDERARTSLQRLVDEGARDDRFYSFSPEEHREKELQLIVDATVTNMLGGGMTTLEQRLFTGTVTQVKQNDEGIVTFNALDRRHELNRNMVKLDTSESGEHTDDIIHHLLGDQLGLEHGSEYEVRIRGASEKIKETWGVGGTHATLFEVLMDLARIQNAVLHIDEHNKLHFIDMPTGMLFTSETMSPIIDWESGDEETSQDIFVESPYDETGLGIYAPVVSDADVEQHPSAEGLSKTFQENNVFSRRALTNVRGYEWVSNELMRDSGVIHIVGDPRVGPWDEFLLDGNSVDGFAPISHGQYTCKTVRHLINGSDGYITEIELGTSPEELFERFVLMNRPGVSQDELEEEAMDELGWAGRVGVRLVEASPIF